MPTATTINYDVVNRGVYKLQSVIRKEYPVFTYGQDVLFGGPAMSSAEDFLSYNYSEKGIVIPKEALRGADPNRRNFGMAFDENHIASLFFFDEFVFDAEKAKNRVPGEVDLTKPWSVEQRLIYLVSQAQDEWMAGVKKAVESAVWNVILTGKHTVRNGGEQAFPVSDDLLGLAGSTLITNPTGTLKDASLELIHQGVFPSRIIFNPTDWTNLVNSDKFLKLLDTRNYFGSSVESSQISNGAALVGIINVPAVGRVYAYTYAGADDGTYYLPQGKAVILGSNPIGYVGHCGVYVNMGDFQGKAGLESYAYLWGESRGAMVDTMIQFEAAPCPLLTAINGYGVITGIPSA